MLDFSTFKTEMYLVRLLVFILVTSSTLYGQDTEEEDELDILLDALFFDEETLLDDLLESIGERDFIYTGLSYNSNTFFSGRKAGSDNFNVVPQLSYYHKSGFTLALSGIYYQTFEPSWGFTTASVGYQTSFGKNKPLHYYGGYTRYFYPSEEGIFSNSIDLIFGVRNGKRTLGSRIALAYLFGDDTSFQLVSSTYLVQTLIDGKGYVIKLRPQINFIVAQQTVIQEVIRPESDQVMFELVSSDIFGLLNTQINLPIYLSTKSFDVQLGYTLNIPTAVGEESSLDTTGLFTCSIGFLIDLKKR